MTAILRKYAPWAIAAGSGLLLAIAFPPFGQADAAWFALVPALLLFRNSKPGKSFPLGLLFGSVFWITDLFWLVRLKETGPAALVYLGTVALALWCALYFALFARAVSWLWNFRNLKASPWARLFLAVIAEPLLWVGAEYLRGWVFSGFAWNPLSASQYKNIALLHCISWLGPGTLSFLIVAVNAGIASMLARIWQDVFARTAKVSSDATLKYRKFPIRTAELMVALTAVVSCWMYGFSAVREPGTGKESIRIGLMHPDIPCVFETDGDSFAEAYERLADYSEMSRALSPDINLWPESALPGYVPYSKEAYLLSSNALATSSALLLSGAIEYAGTDENDEDVIYNSAMLFAENGYIESVYRKRHLVPFGEYIPGYKLIPSLKKLAPTGYTCEAGDSAAPITAKIKDKDQDKVLPVKFGLLICFEDVFPYLSRETTRQGAQVLACVANDSWFDGSCEAEQHLAQAVLRSVENRRPMARSTNRGVTSLISKHGRILQRLGDGYGGGTPGFFVGSVTPEPSDSLTLYTRCGDWLLGIPAGIILAAVALFSFRESFKGKSCRKSDKA